MVSIVVHFLLGLGCIAWIVASNPKVYAKPAGGSWLSPLECVYYAAGIASIALGYWFNLISGPASYPEFIKGQFATPACGSGNQDYMIANVILMPVFTIIDGYRRGLRRPWLFFLSSFFTSFAFPFAFYFATIERQRRHAQSSSAATTVDA
jgi:hypothetical protein